jgi:hypothetical protein
MEARLPLQRLAGRGNWLMEHTTWKVLAAIPQRGPDLDAFLSIKPRIPFSALVPFDGDQHVF